jgi:hypothetical protein
MTVQHFVRGKEESDGPIDWCTTQELKAVVNFDAKVYIDLELYGNIKVNKLLRTEILGAGKPFKKKWGKKRTMHSIEKKEQTLCDGNEYAPWERKTMKKQMKKHDVAYLRENATVHLPVRL